MGENILPPKKMKTKQNIEKLAYNIVNNWDLDTLREYVIDSYKEQFNDMSNDEFMIEWNTFYNEGEE